MEDQEDCETLIELAHDSADSGLWRAAANQFEAARLLLHKSPQSDASLQMHVLVNEAGCLERLGDYEGTLVRAEGALSIWQSLDSDDVGSREEAARAMVLRGDALSSLGRTPEAVKAYGEATSSFCDDEHCDVINEVCYAQWRQAELLELSGRPGEAFQKLEVLIDVAFAREACCLSEIVARATLRGGHLLADLGRPTDALAWFRSMHTLEQAHDDFDAGWAALALIAEADTVGPSDLATALTLYNRAIDIARARNGHDGVLRDALYHKAAMLQHHGDPKQALVAFEAVLATAAAEGHRKDDGQYAAALVGRGLSLQDLGDYGSAEQCFADAIVRLSGNADPAVRREVTKAQIASGALEMNAGRFESAARLFGNAASLALTDGLVDLHVDAVLQYASVRGAQGRADEALTCLDTLLTRFDGADDQRSRLSVARALLAKIGLLIRAGRGDGAHEELGRILGRFADSQEEDIREVVEHARRLMLR